MTEIFNSGSLPSEELKAYRADFNRGFKILKEASKEYVQTTEIHKKEQLQKAMQETITAMNQILNNVLHEKGKKMEEDISKDYQNFVNNTNEDNLQRLNEDIKRAKNFL